MPRTYENAKGDTAEVHGLTLTVELGERTKAEITSELERVIEWSRLVREQFEELEHKHSCLVGLAREMYPYVGDACPDECRYRAECEGEYNQGMDGRTLVCVAYGHIGERLRELGIKHDG